MANITNGHREMFVDGLRGIPGTKARHAMREILTGDQLVLGQKWMTSSQAFDNSSSFEGL